MPKAYAKIKQMSMSKMPVPNEINVAKCQMPSNVNANAITIINRHLKTNLKLILDRLIDRLFDLMIDGEEEESSCRWQSRLFRLSPSHDADNKAFNEG